jgi:hypothetical protein
MINLLLVFNKQNSLELTNAELDSIKNLKSFNDKDAIQDLISDLFYNETINEKVLLFRQDILNTVYSLVSDYLDGDQVLINITKKINLDKQQVYYPILFLVLGFYINSNYSELNGQDFKLLNTLLLIVSFGKSTMTFPSFDDTDFINSPTQSDGSYIPSNSSSKSSSNYSSNYSSGASTPLDSDLERKLTNSLQEINSAIESAKNLDKQEKTEKLSIKIEKESIQERNEAKELLKKEQEYQELKQKESDKIEKQIKDSKIELENLQKQEYEKIQKQIKESDDYVKKELEKLQQQANTFIKEKKDVDLLKKQLHFQSTPPHNPQVHGQQIVQMLNYANSNPNYYNAIQFNNLLKYAKMYGVIPTRQRVQSKTRKSKSIKSRSKTRKSKSRKSKSRKSRSKSRKSRSKSRSKKRH